MYDVLQAFAVTNPALQHLVKKALAVGQRGHKDAAEDLQDIIDSALRAKELECKPAIAKHGRKCAYCGAVTFRNVATCDECGGYL